LEVKLICVTE